MKYILHVDSRDRDATAYPNPATYRVSLPRRLKNVTGAKLLSAEVPFTFYVFSAALGNTSLAVSLNGAAATLSIPDGNYTGSTIAAAVQAALAAAYPGFAFAVSIDAASLRTTIACQQGGTLVVDATADSGRSSLAYALGFQEGAALASATGSVTSPNVVNLNPYTYVVLCIAEFQSSTVLETGLGGDALANGAPAFAKLPFQGSIYDYNFVGTGSEFQALPEVRMLPARASVAHLTIELRFHDGALIDFNGTGEHSFSLMVSTRDAPNPNAEPPAPQIPRIALPRDAGAEPQQRADVGAAAAAAPAARDGGGGGGAWKWALAATGAAAACYLVARWRSRRAAAAAAAAVMS